MKIYPIYINTLFFMIFKLSFSSYPSTSNMSHIKVLFNGILLFYILESIVFLRDQSMTSTTIAEVRIYFQAYFGLHLFRHESHLF